VLREELDVSPGAQTAELCQVIRGGWGGQPYRRSPLVVVPPSTTSDSIPDRLQRLVSRDFAEQLLSTRGQVVRERRVVTILFSDVKDSTSMAEHLDPEEVMEVMECALDVLIEPIARYEGTLARFMGDAILAFFGAPIAHEDDAERACRAALEIIKGAKAYASQLEQQRGISGFNVRVAIHTGLVVVGEVGTDLRVGYTAMGDAVNVASGMGEAAEPGTMLVTEDTHRLIAPLFETEALGRIGIRNRAEPVEVYQLLAPRDVVGKGRGISGLMSPMVGRAAELGALQKALERLQAGVGGIVTVMGEAGIGKSRLVAEIQRSAIQPSAISNSLFRGQEQSREATQQESRAIRWVEGRCLSYGTSMAYLLWRDALRSVLGISGEASPTAVRGILRRLVQALCSDHFHNVFPYLARLMSLPLAVEEEGLLRSLQSEALKRNTFRAVETLIESIARQQPLVIQCEDLHWADATSIELLEQLLALTDHTSLLLICVFRPHREHSCWRIRETASRLYGHRHIDLSLDALSDDESQLLVDNLLRVETLSPRLRRRILDHAEGNPFYVEEIIRSLIAGEAILHDDATGWWHVAQQVEDIAIPDTLQGVLTARIDRLEEDARRVLQAASVIGRIFPYRILEAVAATVVVPGACPWRSRRTLHDHLQILQREEMIRERARMPELEYIFKHHLTQEAAYNGLLRKERRITHRQVAEMLGQLSPDRAEEHLGLLAHHWEQAGEREKAIEYLRRAGEQAAAQFANEEAVAYFSRALDLILEEDLAGRYDLLLALEGVYDLRGEREAQKQSLATLDALADALEDDGRRAEVALRQTWCATTTNDYPAAIAAARRAVRLASVAGDVLCETKGYLQLGQALCDQGDHGAARCSIAQGLALARSVGSRSLEAEGLRRLGFACWYQGDFDEAIMYCEHALLLFRELGDRKWEADSLYTLGEALLGQGRYDAARARLDQCLRINREIGHRLDEGFSLMIISEVLVCFGDYSEARSYLKQALPILRQAGSARGEGLVLAHLGEAAHYLGDDEAAQPYCRRALLVGQDAADRFVQADALSSLGDALASLGHLDEAADAYQKALDLRRQMNEHHRANQPLAGLASVALAQGDVEGAQAHVEEILSYLETGTLDGTREPFLVYLTCYRVLQANGDSRANEVLQEAHGLLQERAAKISDEGERRSFLKNVAAHRELVSEYARGEYVLVGGVGEAEHSGVTGIGQGHLERT